ncbi:HDOD domain-containing protein [Congregibacter variabilis]|uniref:HDOD domain-containing protein n=1 Tax=Congregibacter variabilis TaxID=3081200 RepID=A0ABZ0I5K9_9GAMM|nr:HDOD domain-containing protein [Congregibacter sp. IMCC43200]
MNEVRLLSVTERERLALKRVEECESLPVLPVVVSTLLAMDEDNPYGSDHALSIARIDPCFAVRVIALAQRAHGGDVQGTLPLGQSIRALGKDGLVTPLLEHSKILVFAPTDDAQKHLWLHALQVAALSEQLAYFLSNEIDGELAYFAGLIHDLGRFVAYFKESDLPIHIESHGLLTPEDLTDSESSKNAVSHTLVGATAAEVWGLPKELREVIGNHHRLNNSLEQPSPTSMLIAVVRFADTISHQLMSGVEPESEAFQNKTSEYLRFDSLFTADVEALTERVIRLSRRCLDESFISFHKLEIGETNYTKHKISS